MGKLAEPADGPSFEAPSAVESFRERDDLETPVTAFPAPSTASDPRRGSSSPPPFDTTMHRLLRIAVTAAETADFAGLTLLDSDGGFTTPHFTDERTLPVDQVQYDTGRGPCLDAWRRDRIVHIADVDEVEDRYPEFSRVAREAGIAATLGVPLHGEDGPVGALNLYTGAKGPFTDGDIQVASTLADLMGVAVVNACALSEASTLVRQLTEALQSRAVIEQAKGVIMATTGTDPDTAFDLLRKQSQAENRKVRVLAHELVMRQRPTPSR